MRNLSEACKDCPNRFYALDLCFNSCSSSIPREILHGYEYERNKKDSAIIEQIKADIFNACADDYYMPVHTLSCDEICDIIDKYK